MAHTVHHFALLCLRKEKGLANLRVIRHSASIWKGEIGHSTQPVHALAALIRRDPHCLQQLLPISWDDVHFDHPPAHEEGKEGVQLGVQELTQGLGTEPHRQGGREGPGFAEDRECSIKLCQPITPAVKQPVSPGNRQMKFAQGRSSAQCIVL
ncbi:hypothetical protein KC19_12G072400 [Ceratodon purpureus]|uniref:Uncharacterized protein n=1 Tax=Ceratodon purpureus TaxID=3225 RepID=A0A8T0G6X3_CERPU|nr:hypothetical protein KC19_12G072400 [Ceratodon purpureus]